MTRDKQMEETKSVNIKNSNGKGSITISFFQTLLVVISILVSTGMFIGLSQSRLSNAESEIMSLKNIEIASFKAELNKIKESNNQMVMNQLVIFSNLKRLMEKQGVRWENTLPDNYIDLIK